MILGIFIVSTLAIRSILAILAPTEQEKANSFHKVIATFRGCGVVPEPDLMREICVYNNYEDASFRHLNFMLFCCLESQLGMRTTDCSMYAQPMMEPPVAAWESRVREDEAELFAHSQATLQSFCLFLMSQDRELATLEFVKTIQEVVTESEAKLIGLQSSLRNVVKDQEELVKRTEQVRGVEIKRAGKVRKAKGKAKAARNKIKLARQRLLSKPSLLDRLLSPGLYILLWVVYVALRLWNPPSIRHISEQLLGLLLLATILTFLLQQVYITRVAPLIPWMDPMKTRLFLKSIVFFYFLHGMRIILGSPGQLDNLRRLKTLRMQCERLAHRSRSN